MRHRARRPRRPTATILLAPALLTVAACGADDTGDGRLVVAVAFTPIEQIVRAVAGDLVEIVQIVPPGESAHEYEPTPRQMTDLERADVVLYFGDDFQPTVERSIDDLADDVVRVDLLGGLDLLESGDAHEADESGHDEHGEHDPHVWLDPQLMREMSAVVVDTLATAAPAIAEELAVAADAFDGELAALDAEHRERLATCEGAYLVTTHRAFAYFAAAYGLEQVSIAGITPGGEPSAQALETVTEFVDAEDVSTLFVEGTLDDALVGVVADATGADVVAISDLETFTEAQRDAGATYVSVMRANLDLIATGLDCG